MRTLTNKKYGQDTTKKLDPERKRAAVAALVLAVTGGAFIWHSLAAVNPNLQGDLNGDNKVTIADLSILLSNFNKTTPAADLNGDGKVTVADLSILLSNYGKTSSGNPSPAPTPTPPAPAPTPTPPTPGNPTVSIDGKNYPNPLTLKNGNAVTTTAVWESQRRPELLDLFRQNEYGYIPEPTNVTFNATSATSGNVVRKNVTVNFTGPGGSGSFPFRIFIPKGTTKPKGTFVMLDHRNSGSDDFNQNSGYLPVATITQAGYAIAVINANDTAPDSNGSFRNNVLSKMVPQDQNNSARAIGAWSWTAMRAMDYLQTDTDIDPKKVAVIGHSRSAKASLWAGAQDTRFCAVIANDAGNSGTKLARRGDAGIGAETVSAINSNFPYWFPQTYKDYSNKVDQLPIDQHELTSLVAPRRVIVASASGDNNGDPQGEFLGWQGATPVYQLYGLGNNGLGGANWPIQMDKDYRGDAMSYHERNGAHDLASEDWNMYLNGNIFDRSQ